MMRRNTPVKERLIGLVGNAKVYGTIADTLRRANISFIRERTGNAVVKKTCHFYSQITLAIAWSPFIVTNESLRGEYRFNLVNRLGHIDQESVDYWHAEKPAERFTNPQWFDIPTIGYAKYASFQEYGTEFLCETDSCVLDLIARIERGDMDDAVARVRDHVKRDTDFEQNGKLLRTFLSDVTAWKQSKTQGQMFYGNSSWNDGDLS
jgi:hypothetical protein